MVYPGPGVRSRAAAAGYGVTESRIAPAAETETPTPQRSDRRLAFTDAEADNANPSGDNIEPETERTVNMFMVNEWRDPASSTTDSIPTSQPTDAGSSSAHNDRESRRTRPGGRQRERVSGREIANRTAVQEQARARVVAADRAAQILSLIHI